MHGQGPAVLDAGRALWRSPPSPLLALAGFYFSPAGQLMRSRARWFAEDPWGGARPLLWRDSLAHGPGASAGRAWTRNLHAPSSRTTSRPPWRGPIPISPTNPRTTFSSTRWWGRAFPACCCWRPGARSGSPPPGRSAPRIPNGRLPGRRAGRRNRQPAVHGVHHSDGSDLLRHHRTRGRHAPTATPLPVRRLPLALPLLYFAVRIAFADHALALAQRDLAAGHLRHRRRALRRIRRDQRPVVLARPARRRAEGAEHRRPPGGLSPRDARPASAPRAPPKIRSTPGTASLPSVPPKTTLPATEQCLRAAIAAHPTWFKPHWTLAQVLSFQGATRRPAAKPRWPPIWTEGNTPKWRKQLQELSAR